VWYFIPAAMVVLLVLQFITRNPFSKRELRLQRLQAEEDMGVRQVVDAVRFPLDDAIVRLPLQHSAAQLALHAADDIEDAHRAICALITHGQRPALRAQWAWRHRRAERACGRANEPDEPQPD